MSEKEFILDDDEVHVNFFQSQHSLVIELLTNDREAIELTARALRVWFMDKGLTESKKHPFDKWR